MKILDCVNIDYYGESSKRRYEFLSSFEIAYPTELSEEKIFGQTQLEALSNIIQVQKKRRLEKHDYLASLSALSDTMLVKGASLMEILEKKCYENEISQFTSSTASLSSLVPLPPLSSLSSLSDSLSFIHCNEVPVFLSPLLTDSLSEATYNIARQCNNRSLTLISETPLPLLSYPSPLPRLSSSSFPPSLSPSLPILAQTNPLASLMDIPVCLDLPVLTLGISWHHDAASFFPLLGASLQEKKVCASQDENTLNTLCCFIMSQREHVHDLTKGDSSTKKSPREDVDEGHLGKDMRATEGKEKPEEGNRSNFTILSDEECVRDKDIIEEPYDESWWDEEQQYPDDGRHSSEESMGNQKQRAMRNDEGWEEGRRGEGMTREMMDRTIEFKGSSPLEDIARTESWRPSSDIASSPSPNSFTTRSLEMNPYKIPPPLHSSLEECRVGQILEKPVSLTPDNDNFRAVGLPPSIEPPSALSEMEFRELRLITTEQNASLESASPRKTLLDSFIMPLPSKEEFEQLLGTYITPLEKFFSQVNVASLKRKLESLKSLPLQPLSSTLLEKLPLPTPFLPPPHPLSLSLIPQREFELIVIPEKFVSDTGSWSRARLSDIVKLRIQETQKERGVRGDVREKEGKRRDKIHLSWEKPEINKWLHDNFNKVSTLFQDCIASPPKMDVSPAVNQILQDVTVLPLLLSCCEEEALKGGAQRQRQDVETCRQILLEINLLVNCRRMLLDQGLVPTILWVAGGEERGEEENGKKPKEKAQKMSWRENEVLRESVMGLVSLCGRKCSTWDDIKAVEADLVLRACESRDDQVRAGEDALELEREALNKCKSKKKKAAKESKDQTTKGSKKQGATNRKREEQMSIEMSGRGERRGETGFPMLINNKSSLFYPVILAGLDSPVLQYFQEKILKDFRKKSTDRRRILLLFSCPISMEVFYFFALANQFPSPFLFVISPFSPSHLSSIFDAFETGLILVHESSFFNREGIKPIVPLTPTSSVPPKQLIPLPVDEFDIWAYQKLQLLEDRGEYSSFQLNVQNTLTGPLAAFLTVMPKGQLRGRKEEGNSLLGGRRSSHESEEKDVRIPRRTFAPPIEIREHAIRTSHSVPSSNTRNQSPIYSQRATSHDKRAVAELPLCNPISPPYPPHSIPRYGSVSNDYLKGSSGRESQYVDRMRVNDVGGVLSNKDPISALYSSNMSQVESSWRDFESKPAGGVGVCGPIISRQDPRQEANINLPECTIYCSERFYSSCYFVFLTQCEKWKVIVKERLNGSCNSTHTADLLLDSVTGVLVQHFDECETSFFQRLKYSASSFLTLHAYCSSTHAAFYFSHQNEISIRIFISIYSNLNIQQDIPQSGTISEWTEKMKFYRKGNEYLQWQSELLTLPGTNALVADFLHNRLNAMRMVWRDFLMAAKSLTPSSFLHQFLPWKENNFLFESLHRSILASPSTPIDRGFSQRPDSAPPFHHVTTRASNEATAFHPYSLGDSMQPSGPLFAYSSSQRNDFIMEDSQSGRGRHRSLPSREKEDTQLVTSNSRHSLPLPPRIQQQRHWSPHEDLVQSSARGGYILSSNDGPLSFPQERRETSSVHVDRYQGSDWRGGRLEVNPASSVPREEKSAQRKLVFNYTKAPR